MRRFIYKLLLLILCLSGSWAAGFAWFITLIPEHAEDNDSTTDAIVVLTGGKGRLLTGITLLEENKAKKLLISGVGEKSTIADLQHLSEEMPARQIKPLKNRIMLGHMAYSTQTNAIETAIWMEFEHYNSLRLVTSNYHMPRSMLQFKAEMPDVSIIPNPVFPAHFKLMEWWKFPGSAKLLISEYHKFIAVGFAVLCNIHVAPFPVKD